MERGDVPSAAEETITLPAEPASAARARQFVRDRLRKWDHASEELEDAAMLCVTELVANVSLHTSSCECEVTVRDSVETVTIEVSDDTAELPAAEPVSLEADHGRGLRIVDSLAGEWGVRRTSERRKSVWLRLPDD